MLTHRTDTILGDIPEDWGRGLLADLLEEQRGGDWGDESGEVPFSVLRSTNFTNRGTLDFSDVAVRYFTAKKAEKMGLRSKDLLLERSGGGPTQPVGRIGFIESDLPDNWFSNFVQLLRPDSAKIDPEFLGWILLELNQSGVVERLQHQTTQMRNLDFRDYLRVYLPKPPTGEQEAISRVLRTANESLAAAEAKLTAARRLKTALLQQLFTRGIPGRHGRFKQTKIGEIPESWEVTKISEIISRRIFNGFSPQSRPDPPGTPILNVSCISSGLCDLSKVTYVDLDATPSEDYMANDGDFFILRGNGNRDYIATGGVLKEQPPDGCVFSDLLFKVPFDTEKVVESFMPLLWQSSSFLRRLQSKAVSGSGLWKIGLREIHRHLFAKPSKPEQQEIVDLLSSADESISSCEREVSALERLKRSLLQNLLTGKVRIKPLESSP